MQAGVRWDGFKQGDDLMFVALPLPQRAQNDTYCSVCADAQRTCCQACSGVVGEQATTGVVSANGQCFVFALMQGVQFSYGLKIGA